MKAFVYWNLRYKIWSIRAEEGPWKGLVVAHADEVILDEVTFKVSEAGRQRVLASGRKNVHAGAVGTVVAWKGTHVKGKRGVKSNWSTASEHTKAHAITSGIKVSYNPKNGPHFVKYYTPDQATAAKTADHLYFGPGKVLAFDTPAPYRSPLADRRGRIDCFAPRDLGRSRRGTSSIQPVLDGIKRSSKIAEMMSRKETSSIQPVLDGIKRSSEIAEMMSRAGKTVAYLTESERKEAAAKTKTRKARK